MKMELCHKFLPLICLRVMCYIEVEKTEILGSD